MTRDERIAQIREAEVGDLASFPLRQLEIVWIDATALYEVLDDAIMSDRRWDELTRFLRIRRNELSPYFRNCVPYACLAASTGSGIAWESGIPALAVEALKQ